MRCIGRGIILPAISSFASLLDVCLCPTVRIFSISITSHLILLKRSTHQQVSACRLLLSQILSLPKTFYGLVLVSLIFYLFHFLFLYLNNVVLLTTYPIFSSIFCMGVFWEFSGFDQYTIF